MLKESYYCCFCHCPFSSLAQPRMMPHCQHNSCTPCLKQLLISGSCPSITCSICGIIQTNTQLQLENFPKNIALIKLLKDKCSLQPTYKEEEPCDTEESNGSAPSPINYCLIHKKELEIVCLTDNVRICAHCALFSSHRTHQLKTVQQLLLIVQTKTQQFRNIKIRKLQLDQRVTGTEFRDHIIGKIANHKNFLLGQIKSKF